jgi:large subunit ribosomal protein L18
MPKNTRNDARVVRHARIRKRVEGNPAQPRLAVFRSLKHISAQIIDDTSGKTLASAGSQEKALKALGNREGAKAIGAVLAERAQKAGVTTVVFDRGGFRYHGRVASLAEGARQGGLKF